MCRKCENLYSTFLNESHVSRDFDSQSASIAITAIAKFYKTFRNSVFILVITTCKDAEDAESLGAGIQENHGRLPHENDSPDHR